MIQRFLFILTVFFSLSAQALTVDTHLENPAQEARAQALFRTLRCVVCAGESIADSPASVAQDMRRVVRQQMEVGKTDEEIIAYLSSQYGQRVRMLPAFNTGSLLLYAAPLLMLLSGGFMAWKTLFRRGNT